MINQQIYNNMKKLSLIFILVAFLVSVPASYAQTLLQNTKTGTTASKSAIKTQVETNSMENLRQRARAEITRRITFLTELSVKIDNLKKLSGTDKTSLKSQIQSQIDTLNALNAKIDSDTDITTLRADVKSIINGYYTFAYFRVKISLFVAAGRLSTTADILNVVYTKLQARISEKQAKGEDTTSLNALLSDMLVKITDARTQHDAAIAILNTLDATSFTQNKSSFSQVRSKIKLGADSLRIAYQDAVKIRQGLGDISGNLKKGTFETKESTKSSTVN